MKNSPIDPIQAYIGADMLKVGPEQREKLLNIGDSINLLLCSF